MRVRVTLALLLAACACGKGSELSQAVHGIAELRDRVCACKDKACADAVEHDWVKFERANEHLRREPEFSKIDDEYESCFKATMSRRETATAAEPWTLPAECVAWGAQIEKLRACKAVSEFTRTTLIEGYESSSRSKAWRGQSPAPREMLAKSCATSASAVVTVLREKCP